jgi:DNA-binding transcriptional LysR family regulator
MKPVSWDDLRYVLAIAREGNLAAAALSVGVNHSTMFRRLHALERKLGAKLFERLAHGYQPTESGVRLIETAERMETEAIALDRQLTGRDTRLEGRLRVTCSETLAHAFLTAEIARFHAAHPGIVVDLMVDNRVIDLSRREADVALRATRPKEGDLFGRKLTDIRWALYGSVEYLKQHPAPKRIADLERHLLIGWTDTAPQTKAAAWLARNGTARVAFRSSGIVNQFFAATEGLGIAVLPTYLAARDRRLVRVLGPLKDLSTELWIVTHRSLKDTARVRSFMEMVGAGLKSRLASGSE